jgi:hypothetical protein
MSDVSVAAYEVNAAEPNEVLLAKRESDDSGSVLSVAGQRRAS